MIKPRNLNVNNTGYSSLSGGYGSYFSSPASTPPKAQSSGSGSSGGFGGSGWGMAAQAISAAGKGYYQYQAGQKEEKAYDYNATIARNEAQNISAMGQLEQYKMQRRSRSISSSQISAIAGSGINLTGSPLLVMEDTLANLELDMAVERFNTQVASSQKMAESRMLQYYGDVAGHTATTQALTGLFDTGSSMASSYKGGK